MTLNLLDYGEWPVGCGERGVVNGDRERGREGEWMRGRKEKSDLSRWVVSERSRGTR